MTNAGRLGRAGLPQVDAVLRLPAAEVLVGRFGRPALREAVRARIASIRVALPDSEVAPTPEEVLEQAGRELAALVGSALRPVINATGVVLHTNLGRAPLSGRALSAVVDAAGYSTVEFDTATGGRGSRTAHVAELVCQLLGAESAHAVNNGAAALLLAVAALGAGREVIVSRGELVEIGGSFRLPEIIAASGARLVEVGTTNRTRAADYAAAVGPDTALILKVHPSNFRQVGFTEEAELEELVGVGRVHGIPVVHDVGSGLLGTTDVPALAREPVARDSLAVGADLVLFSGDKLLGGPQAGILAGTSSTVDRCRSAPIARALRLDKLQVAALEATLTAHLRDEGDSELPAVRMLHLSQDELRDRAVRLAADLAAEVGDLAQVDATPIAGRVGGGASPEATVPSYGVSVEVDDPSYLLARLRLGEQVVVARVGDGRLIIDLRTVAVEEERPLVHALVGALREADDAA